MTNDTEPIMVSSFLSPPSSSRRRRGVSILEVLFAVLITTVGLLGAIAIFPVASARARQARLNDATAAAGRSAVHMVDTMGMRRPLDRWYSWNGSRIVPFTLTATANSVQWQQGASYCIDSRFVVRNTAATNWNKTSAPVVHAEYFPYTSPMNTPSVYMQRIAFFPGTLDAGGTLTKDQFDRNNNLQPVGSVPSYGRNILLADSLFTFDDDLVFVRPGLDDVSNLGMTNDRSLPAFQRFDQATISGSTVTTKRQSQGHMSWMATIVPKIDLYAGLGSDQYILSIVVFYDRPTDLFLQKYTNTQNPGNENVLERTVTVTFQTTTGETGGEVLLSWPATQSATNDDLAAQRLKLRANDWILLSGTQTFGANSANRFQWYRVAHCDPEIDYGNNVANAYSRYVTLMGQDWNTSLTNQQATIMEGVVAVYEKTIRLDYGSSF